MEHATRTLIVITLLQQCRAEISEIIPGTWFSANIINDEYSPKPIMELFTSESPGFSTSKPIIVLPSQSSSFPAPEVTHLSTPLPDIQSSTPLTISTTPRTTYSSTYETSTAFPSTITSFPPTITSFPSSPYSPISSTFSLDSTTATTAFPPPEPLPVFTFPNSPPNSIQASLSTQNVQRPQTNTYRVTTKSTSLIPQTSTTPYLVLNQNTQRTGPSSTRISTRTPVQFPASTATTRQKNTENTITPFIRNTLTDETNRPTVTFRSTPPTSSSFTTPMTPVTASPCDPTVKVSNPTNSPLIYPGPPNSPFLPNLKIRVIAPKGSITNIRINPSTTTKSPTTRKPKVKRSKNTHETCVDNCKGKREPICAVPLGTLMVEPKVLKGFPSICHMACHNSFKKDPFEKIVDGRCGRIRTRIIRVGSQTKLHREELKKSEYSIINNGPEAVVELAGNAYDNRRRKH